MVFIFSFLFHLSSSYNILSSFCFLFTFFLSFFFELIDFKKRWMGEKYDGIRCFWNLADSVWYEEKRRRIWSVDEERDN